LNSAQATALIQPIQNFLPHMANNFESWLVKVIIAKLIIKLLLLVMSSKGSVVSMCCN
jgi:hypothetical protein